MIQQKAAYFYAKMYHNKKFKASSGYAQKFVRRFDFRRRKLCGEKVSSDVDASINFKKKIRDLIKEKNLFFK